MSTAARALGIGADTTAHHQHFTGADPSAASAARRAAAGAASNTAGGTVLKRTLYVNITDSLANLAMKGPSAGTWKIVDGKSINVFGAGTDVDTQLATNQLRSVDLKKIRVVQDRSTFPVGLGVHINCAPLHEMTDLGERFAYTVLPFMVNPTGHLVYECDVGSEDSQRWRKDFPKWTSANLETEGVLNVENNPWVFVHEDHPAVSLLRHNPELIGCQIDDQPKIDNQWYKVSRQVLSACCATLRSSVLNKVTSNDLNLFQVQIKRLNAESWDEMNQDIEAALSNPNLSKEEAERFLSTPYSYTARLELVYEVQHAG